MTTVVAQPELAHTIRIDGSRLYEIVNEICALAERQRKRSEYFRRCFEIICRHFGADSGVFNLRLGARTLEQTFSATEIPSQKWLAVADSLVLRAQTDESSLVKLYRSQSGAAVAYALAAPILSSGGRPIGALAFIVNDTSFDETRSQLVLLNQLLELVVENAPTANGPVNDDPESRALRSVVRATDYRSIHHLGFAIVNSLCSKLSCEQIVLGLVHRRDVRLLAVSGLDTIPRNTPGIMAVQQSMSVCLDRNEMTVVQEKKLLPDQVESSPCRVHHFWHRVSGDSAVATIPLRVDGQCVAVIALRRKSSQPFIVEDLQRARVLAESFAPALPLVDQASRSVARHVMESFGEGCRRFLSWRQLGRKAALVMVLLIVAWGVFGKLDYHVLAPGTLVPQQINVISAPFEGRVAEVMVIPGKSVRRGELVLRMDARELELEKKRVLSEIAAARIQCNQQLQDRETREAFLLQAQIRVLETELELIHQQIHRADVRALSDGVVLPTDIHRRIGQIVELGEPLLEVADSEQWQLEIETSESDLRYLRVAQHGNFQTYARPDQPFECRVTAIEPAAQIVNQNNIVMARAELLTREPWMKFGMEGHVRIRTEPQPVWWIMGHRLVDYLRMKLWL